MQVHILISIVIRFLSHPIRRKYCLKPFYGVCKPKFQVFLPGPGAFRPLAKCAPSAV